MALVTPNIDSSTPGHIAFDPSTLVSNNCTLDISLSIIPIGKINVSIVLEVVPNSHYMFTNNQSSISKGKFPANDGDSIQVSFVLKKRKGVAGHPNIIVVVRAGDATNNQPGGSDQISYSQP